MALANDAREEQPTSRSHLTIDDLTFNPELPTPIYITSRVRFILLAAVGLIFVWLCFAAPSVPRLIILGATVSLILSFPVRLLSRWMPRGVAILVVIGSTIALAIISLALVIPFSASEISQFTETLPDTLDNLQDLLRRVLIDFRARGFISQDPDTIIDNIEATMFSRGEAVADALLNNLVTTLTGTFNLLITTFGVIFIATYLLIDIPRFHDTFIRSFAPEYRSDASILWKTLGDSLSRYLAGLLVSIAVQGTLVTIGLYFIGVPYALLLGIFMSATAILPYVGAFVGAVPSVLLALTISWETAVVTVILYIVVNQFDGNFVTPRVQANAVRVHPLLIFLAVIAGTQISGALGAILAVPTLAVIRVLGEFFWVRLRVRGQQQGTLLAAMRNDLAIERIVNQSATPNETRRFARHQPLRYHPLVRPKPVRSTPSVRRRSVAK